MSEPVLYACDALTMVQLKKTLKNVQRQQKAGYDFFVEVTYEDSYTDEFNVKLFGPPNIRFEQVRQVSWRRADAN